MSIANQDLLISVFDTIYLATNARRIETDESMEHGKLAPVDRRIRLAATKSDDRADEVKLSAIRDRRLVVLLGEPGSGKSTVLSQIAEANGAEAMSLTDFCIDAAAPARQRWFLDGLDEIRIGELSNRHALELARLLQEHQPDRIWLTCRSEDWRSRADRQLIAGASIGHPTVVQLMPLDEDEQRAILEALGAQDPAGFVARAKNSAASGFLENPLSLKLLSGLRDWPQTRFELFDLATHQLAHELENPVHQDNRARTSPEGILEAAQLMSLIVLTSRAATIWRSAAPPPGEAFVSRDHLGLDDRVLYDSLDTALFRGDGEVFEPMHRTIAEFLGARALAERIAGANGRLKFPFSRAVGLITGADGKAPSELRGLFAWLAAHLAKLGDEDGAARLIERDAATVLAYGDASVFSAELRRKILELLDLDDPYFRFSEVGLTAMGGLAGEDIASDFEQVLSSPSEAPHKVSTVLDALKYGRPVHSLRPFLRQAALSGARGYWFCREAMDASLNGAETPNEDRRALFDELDARPSSEARAVLRIELAAALPVDMIATEEIRRVIADYEECPTEQFVLGRLYALEKRLIDSPRPELFDQRVARSTPAFPDTPDEEHEPYHDKRREVYRMMNKVLDGQVRRLSDVDPSRMYRWLRNLQQEDPDYYDHHHPKALGEWLDAAPERELGLLDCISDEAPSDATAFDVALTFRRLTQRLPSTSVVPKLVDRAESKNDPAQKLRALEFAIEIARNNVIHGDEFERLHHVTDECEDQELLRRLTVCEVAESHHKLGERAAEKDRKARDRRRSLRQSLESKLSKIRSGSAYRELCHLALMYFGRLTSEGSSKVALDYVANETSAEICAAAVAGWCAVAAGALDGFTPESLARSRKGDKITFDHREVAAFAGLDLALESGAENVLAAAPDIFAIIAMRMWPYFANDDRKKRALSWAQKRLNASAVGQDMLFSYWAAKLDQGEIILDGLDEFANSASPGGVTTSVINRLLAARPDMPAQALRNVLSCAAKLLPSDRICELAQCALASSSLSPEHRSCWRFVRFAVAPAAHREDMRSDTPQASETLLLEHVGEFLMNAFVDRQGVTDPIIDGAIVRMLGPIAPPIRSMRGGTVTQPMKRDMEIRAAMKSLSSCTRFDAGRHLSLLVDDPALSAWHTDLRHARAQQAAQYRDHTFSAPAPSAIRVALEGGAPITPSDLRAVVVEELRALQGEIRSGPLAIWKLFWKGDDCARSKIENDCTDALLTRLEPRLRAYGVRHCLPEAQMAARRRTDFLLMSRDGDKLPVEAKRHWHKDLWIAAAGQLQDYAADPKAAGNGVYLVYWFGPHPARRMPPSPCGGTAPKTARELEERLNACLPDAISQTTDVIVLDVTKPLRG